MSPHLSDPRRRHRRRPQLPTDRRGLRGLFHHRRPHRPRGEESCDATM